MPTTWPCMLTSGPPELPGLIAASVWMAFSTVACELRASPPAETGRFTELTMPEVTVPDSSNGEPIATTPWPIFMSPELPSWTIGRPETPSAWMTAMSELGSRPRILAEAVLPSWNTTLISPPEAAPSMTWLFVTIWPLPEMTNPEPSPAPDRVTTWIWTTDGSILFATSSTEPAGALLVCEAGRGESSELTEDDSLANV